MDPFAAAGVTLEPLEGGWSGETFLATAGGERTVVRIFADPRHHPAGAEIASALLRLVRGLVPVPEVREARPASAESGMPALLVTEHVAGTRGDLLLPTLDDERARLLGTEVGRIAATLAGMPTPHRGTWADGELRIEAYDLPGLPAWMEQHLAAAEGWSVDEVDRLVQVGERAQDLLDSVTRTCVVHSDLNPKNLLVDPATLSVTAVVDWEFSHSGHPFTDLGNLLRFDRGPAWSAGVLDGWRALRGGEIGPADDDIVAMARSADLYALAELAGRAGENPVADRAARQLRGIARTGDLHAMVD